MDSKSLVEETSDSESSVDDIGFDDEDTGLLDIIDTSNPPATPTGLAHPSTELELCDFSDDDDSGNEPDPPDGSTSTSASNSLSFFYPECRHQLQETLRSDYSCPPIPPHSASAPRQLTVEERLSLRHYFAWAQTNGTVKAYKAHAAVLSEATGENILSLHAARKLAATLTKIQVKHVDMCSQSCLAYTGKFIN